ncbi:Cupredoxin [Schizopora paradoxa]|uniref:Cupredoxin n=1 Tax=Schizopora paradoxa TaxID=27342 RepID=A0A0H2STW2_9AGAM|nr:Cupredoxin [Schizopora paradoxa]
MFASTLLALGLVVPFAAAQSMMHTVIVGGSAGNVTFTPEAISASVGDQVMFQFQQKNHSATQSSFAAPCSHKDGGFTSGFLPVAANVTDNFPSYTITVNDTEPIWVYCGQNAGLPTSHCGMGMVFAVNCGPDGSNTSFTSFKNAALAIGQQLQAQANATSTMGSSYGSASAAPAETSTVAAAPPAVSGTSTSSGAATTHTVSVGANGGLEYSPNEITAAAGDVVVFNFMAKNHTITQSSFADPCLKLEKTSTTGQIGFDSGFMPVAANSSSFPSFSIVVNDTTPVWAYCRQTGHCESGMVFAINANDSSSKSFSAFQLLANGSNTTTGEPASSNSTTSSNVSGASRTVGTSAGLALGLVGALFAVVM